MSNRARSIYKAADGQRVPSVTTILSRFKDAGGLLYWANEAGLKGMTLDEARMPAAEAGTMAHALVEAHINQRPEPILEGPEEVQANARRAFQSYLQWQEMTRLAVRHTEVELVSERYRFGGRLDAIIEIGGKLAIGDWKSSNALYSDYLLQCAAYKILWEENYPDHPLVGAHLCRFSKNEADFTHSYFEGLEREEETFLRMRELYDLVKAVDKRVR